MILQHNNSLETNDINSLYGISRINHKASHSWWVRLKKECPYKRDRGISLNINGNPNIYYNKR